MLKNFVLWGMLLFCLALFGENNLIVRYIHPSSRLIEHYRSGDIAAYKPGEFLDLVIKQKDLPDYQAAGFTVYRTENEDRINLKNRIAGYTTYDQMLSELNDLLLLYPDIMRLYNAGDTWGKIYAHDGIVNYANYNQEIWAVKISDNPDTEEDEPNYFYFGSHHAREPLSTEVTLHILRYLLENYATDPTVAALVNTKQIWFVPMVNPNGNTVVNNELDVWWRKNLRDNNNNGSFDTYGQYGYGTDGVDLNRNYGFHFGTVGASAEYDDPTYHGPTSFSEPETQGIKSLLENHSFLAGISFHTYGELVLYPYGHLNNVYAPDYLALKDLAENMAALIPSENGSNYTPQASWELYPAMGGLDDWAYGTSGTFSYTIELSTSFIPETSIVETVKNNVLPAALYMLQRDEKSALTGHVTDAHGQPLAAKVHVSEIDNTGTYREPYFAEENYGRYYRFLMPGTYTVTYSCQGYLARTCSVVITANGQTEQDIVLNQAPLGSIAGQVQNSLGEPIAGAAITIDNEQEIAAISVADGHFFIPQISFGEHVFCVSASNYAPGCFTLEINQGAELRFTLAPAELLADFEEVDGNWLLSGNWGITTSVAHTDNGCLADSPNGSYNNYTDAVATFDTYLDLSGCSSANLTFWLKKDLEQDYDFLYVEVFLQNEWRQIAYYTGIGDWQQETVDLGQFLGSLIKFRFRLVTDEGVYADGVYIDDIYLSLSTATVAATEVVSPTIITELHISPNPFNPQTTVNCQISQAGRTEVSIYNTKGQLVKNIFRGFLPRGKKSFSWNGKNLHDELCASGIYLVRLKQGRSTVIKKITLLK